MGRWWDALRRSGKDEYDTPQPIPEGMKELLDKSHDDLDVIEIEGRQVPLIILDDDRMQSFISWSESEAGAGRGIAINTSFNILHDYMGHVFVEVAMIPGRDTEDADGEHVLKVLINANEHLEFFHNLAESRMLALASTGTDEKNVLGIQLPRPDRIEKALEMIGSAMALGARDHGK